jgi:hypothetical protein
MLKNEYLKLFTDIVNDLSKYILSFYSALINFRLRVML